MNPKKIWANLAVGDLDRTAKFYSELGFKANGPGSSELTSFFFGESNLVIHFFLKDVLGANLNIEIANSQRAAEVVFTLSAASRTEVDAWEQEVKNAGGQIISGAEAFGEGYYGFLFADPDGHRFNVFYMAGL